MNGFQGRGSSFFGLSEFNLHCPRNSGDQREKGPRECDRINRPVKAPAGNSAELFDQAQDRNGKIELVPSQRVLTIRFNPNGRAPPPGNALAFQFSASHRPKTACRNLLRFL
jgi:hypothetical protein